MIPKAEKEKQGGQTQREQIRFKGFKRNQDEKYHI